MANWLFLSFALCMALTSTFAKAEDKPTQPEPAAKADSDKLDLKQLEDKYWAAKDTDFAVVQNRTYAKEKRFFLSANYGVLINDAYSTGRMLNFAPGYYFSERWGVELAYERGSLADNGSTSALQQYNGLKPNQTKFVDYTSANLLWVPMYAKMSVLDHAIWYFDVQFGAGVGILNYKQILDPAEDSDKTKSTIALNFDATANVFFHKHWAFRIDVKNKFSSQQLLRYHQTGVSSPTRDMGTNTQQDTTFLLGFTYFH